MKIKTKAKTPRNNKSLARKVASIMAAVLIVSFGIMAITITLLTKNALTNAIDENFSDMADGNFKVELKDISAYMGQYQDIVTAGHKINANLSQTIRNIYQLSEQVSGCAEHVAGASKIVSSTETISEMVEQISAGGKVQEEYIEQIRHAVKQISSVVQSNAATSEESAASSQELSAQAQNVKELLSKFEILES